MKAIIFIRSNARKLNIEHGHVGWAFETKPGIFQSGSIEDMDINKRWTRETNNPSAIFGIGPENGKYPTYDLSKTIQISNPNIISALETQKHVMNEPYNFIGQNCMDATYLILKNYGCVLPEPKKIWNPIEWFNNINAQANFLMNSVHKIDFSVYEHPNCEGDSERYRSNNETISNPDIHVWGRELGDNVSSIVLRKGKLRIFEHQKYDGQFYDLTQAGLYQLKDFGFEDKMSSFQAWA